MAARKPVLNRTQTNLYIGSSQTLAVKNTSAKVSWSSSNSAVASVNSRGKVIAKKSGSVRFSIANGKNGYALMTK